MVVVGGAVAGVEVVGVEVVVAVVVVEGPVVLLVVVVEVAVVVAGSDVAGDVVDTSVGLVVDALSASSPQAATSSAPIAQLANPRRMARRIEIMLASQHDQPVTDSAERH